MSPSTVSKYDHSFTSIADEFVRALRGGNTPSLEAFIDRYPEFEDEIRDEFPLLLMAEEINLHTRKETTVAPLPEMIGKYRVKSEIGKGGMGRVYAATAPGSKREMAVKVLMVTGSEHRDSLIRFQRETKSAGRLNHPNIVPVVDYGTHDQFLYFVMPRIKGIDLSKLIEGLSLERARSATSNMSMDWRMVAEVGAQVAGALGYAHSQGLIHRDIKPANLIMESNGRVWVSDFGLVKNLRCDQSLSRTGDLIGTPRYMAPEQLRGVSDTRSDIYGLGLTLYELATGNRAWDNLSGQDLIFRRSSLELPPIQSANPAIPDALCTVIMKCCAFRPDDRYQTANEVQYVLNRYLHGHKVGDRRKLRNAERSILKRKPIRVARAVATVAGIGLFVALMYSASRPANPFSDPVNSASLLKDSETRSKFIDQIPALINEVVNSNDTELRRAFGHIAKETLNRTITSDSEIPENVKNDIRQAVEAKLDSLTSEIPRIEGDPMVAVMSPIVAQIQPLAWVLVQVDRSGLKDREKQSARRLLSTLNKQISEGRIDPVRVAALHQKLFELAPPETMESVGGSETAASAMSDFSLRRFLGFVEIEVSASEDMVAVPQQIPSQSNVMRTLDAALKNPEIRKLIQNIQVDPEVRKAMTYP